MKTQIKELKTVKEVLQYIIDINLPEFYICIQIDRLKQENIISNSLHIKILNYLNSQKPSKEINNTFYEYKYYSGNNTWWWIKAKKESLESRLTTAERNKRRKEIKKEKIRFLKYIMYKL